MERLAEVGLKLQWTKCHFVRQEVEFLEHVITPYGLKTIPTLVTAVRDYPTPTNVQEVRHFMGLASYYRKFVSGFAKRAHPLYQLTCKGTSFAWSEDCHLAFNDLKQKLIEAPVLAYHSFNQDFVLELSLIHI